MYASPRYRAALHRARRRYGTGQEDWQKLAVGVAAVAVLGAAAAHGVIHHHHHAAPSAALPSVPSTGLGTRPGWARAFLAAIPEPRTACNLNAVVAWETREGGGFGNQAAFNPVNVNPGPGAPWPGYPAVGAWAFPTARDGLAYTVQTIENGDYGNVLAALRAGNSAQAVCDALMASPWAASRYDGTLTASC